MKITDAGVGIDNELLGVRGDSVAAGAVDAAVRVVH